MGKLKPESPLTNLMVKTHGFAVQIFPNKTNRMIIGSIRSLGPPPQGPTPWAPWTWLLGRHQPLRCGDLAAEQLLGRYSNAYIHAYIVVCNIYIYTLYYKVYIQILVIIYIMVHIYIYICIMVYIYIHIYIYTYIYIYIYIHTHIIKYIYIYMYIYIHMIDAYISITPMYRYIIYILS